MLSPQVTYYRIKDNTRLSVEFLVAIFSATKVQRALSLRAKQSTRDYIEITAQQDLPVLVPDLSEQMRIVEKLKQIEAVVTALGNNYKPLVGLSTALINRLAGI